MTRVGIKKTKYPISRFPRSFTAPRYDYYYYCFHFLTPSDLGSPVNMSVCLYRIKNKMEYNVRRGIGNDSHAAVRVYLRIHTSGNPTLMTEEITAVKTKRTCWNLFTNAVASVYRTYIGTFNTFYVHKSVVCFPVADLNSRTRRPYTPAISVGISQVSMIAIKNAAIAV